MSAPVLVGRLARGAPARRPSAGPGDWVHQLLGDLVPNVDLSGAACAGRAPSHDVAAGRVRAAVRLCGGCPVLARCAALAEATPPRLRRRVVLAGVVYGDGGHPLGSPSL